MENWQIKLLSDILHYCDKRSYTATERHDFLQALLAIFEFAKAQQREVA